MKQRLNNITDTSTKRRGFAALFAIVLIIALAGSTVYATEGAAQKASYPDFKYTVKHNNKYRGKRAAKLWTFFSVFVSFSGLLFFKYASFFINNINSLTGAGLPPVKLLMPIGIS